MARSSKILSAFTIFLGAFLLFQVQPLIGKYILPWFGGSTQVWTTCMLFFQTLLLGGYAYAHLSIRLFRPRTQTLVHILLLLGAVAMLPIVPASAWKPEDPGNPTGRILLLLGTCLGLPYFVLSATGPLMQAWIGRLTGGAPYRLYSLSNVGSLAALLSYPFLFEPNFSRQMQARMWSGGMIAFAAVCGCFALRAAKSPANPLAKAHTAATKAPPASAGAASALHVRMLWLLLPACASLLLMAFTSKICEEVGAIPFLWVLTLSVYLLTFVICFEGPRWYSRFWFALLLTVSLAFLLALAYIPAPVAIILAVHVAVLFFSCMICHGELYRLKPPIEKLTSYYLLIAAGGALGGFLAAIVAPMVLDGYYELHVGLAACLILLLIACFTDARSSLYHGRRRPAWAGLLAGVTALVTALAMQPSFLQQGRVLQSRNFYGVLQVSKTRPDSPSGEGFVLSHGRTIHGFEYAAPGRQDNPTTYYVPASGVGLAILHSPRPPGQRKIGLVGLGVGTLAAYGHKGDSFRFYEINPQICELAGGFFRYLRDCPATVQTVMGDARLSMEREAPQGYDLLVLDAFSGDAVPVHLLTREAFDIYHRHLADNGIIAVHITNRYFDLRSVVANQAKRLGMKHVTLSYNPENRAGALGSVHSVWVLLAPPSSPLLDAPEIRAAAAEKGDDAGGHSLWTDDYNDLLRTIQ